MGHEGYMLIAVLASGVEKEPRTNSEFYIQMANDFERISAEVVDATLNDVREQSAKMQGSRVKITAHMIKDIPQDVAIENALRALSAQNTPNLVFWSDLVFGMSFVSSGILIAESAIAGGEDKMVEKTLSGLEKLGVPQDAASGSQLYLSVTDFGKKSAQSLIDDPTGFKTVDFALDFLRTEMAKPSGQRVSYVTGIEDPTFILKGAEIARNLYKRFYPLTVTG